MPEPNDIGKRYQEIQFLVAEDNVPQAVKRLMDFIRDFSDDTECLNEVIVISSSYHELKKEYRKGVVPFEQYEQRRNRILFWMLGLLDDEQQKLAYKLAS